MLPSDRQILPSLRQVAIATLFVVVAAWAQVCLAAPQCTVLLQQKRSEDAWQMAIGDQVTLAIGNSRGQAATFLGKTGDRYYFLANNQKTIRLVMEADLAFPQTMWAGKRPTAESLLKIISQEDRPSCAAHASVNCLRQLRESGTKLDPELSRKIAAEKEIWEGLRDYVNWEGKAENLGVLFEQGQYSEYLKLFRSSQSVARENYFRQELGLNVRLLEGKTAMKPLREHLDAGKPAILDLAVKPSVVELKIEPDGQVFRLEAFEPASIYEPHAGGHSVVAVSWIKTGFFRNKVLVLDSANGTLNLWSASSIRRALKDMGSVSLVGAPNQP